MDSLDLDVVIEGPEQNKERKNRVCLCCCVLVFIIGQSSVCDACNLTCTNFGHAELGTVYLHSSYKYIYNALGLFFPSFQ
jgi:hypothetical protein